MVRSLTVVVLGVLCVWGCASQPTLKKDRVPAGLSSKSCFGRVFLSQTGRFYKRVNKKLLPMENPLGIQSFWAPTAHPNFDWFVAIGRQFDRIRDVSVQRIVVYHCGKQLWRPVFSTEEKQRIAMVRVGNRHQKQVVFVVQSVDPIDVKRHRFKETIFLAQENPKTHIFKTRKIFELVSPTFYGKGRLTDLVKHDRKMIHTMKLHPTRGDLVLGIQPLLPLDPKIRTRRTYYVLDMTRKIVARRHDLVRWFDVEARRAPQLELLGNYGLRIWPKAGKWTYDLSAYGHDRFTSLRMLGALPAQTPLRRLFFSVSGHLSMVTIHKDGATLFSVDVIPTLGLMKNKVSEIKGTEGLRLDHFSVRTDSFRFVSKVVFSCRYPNGNNKVCHVQRDGKSTGGLRSKPFYFKPLKGILAARPDESVYPILTYPLFKR